MIGTKEAFRHQGIIIGIDLNNEAKNKNIQSTQQKEAAGKTKIEPKKNS